MGAVARRGTQEFQLLVEAPPPATAPAATLYGRRPLLGAGTGTGAGAGFYDIRLSRAVPADTDPDELGYVEVWDHFKTWCPFHHGQQWSAASFQIQASAAGGGGTRRRATALLSEVLLPRGALVRSLNAPITAVPFVWCFVRHRALRPPTDQAAIIYRPVDKDRVFADAALRPPDWITAWDTLWFQLTVPSARIPGEARYIGLHASNPVPVETTDNVGSSLPEFCLVLPSGEIVDFLQYDGNIPLPAEAPPDEWASINATLTLQFQEALVPATHGAKRMRT